MKINLLYFTSTGNTLFLSQKAKEFLEASNHTVKLFEVLASNYKDVITCDMLGIMYPVWCSSFPTPIIEFANKLIEDQNHKLKIFLIGNCASFSGNTGHFWKNKLEAVGHTVVYTAHVKMPSNLNILKILAQELTIEQINKITEKALTQLKVMCEEISNGITKDKECCFFFGTLFAWLQRCAIPWKDRTAHKLLSVNKNICVKCGYCIRLCPLNNIHFTENKTISFGNKCILCAKCFNYCPTQAIMLGKKTADTTRFRRYHCSHVESVAYREGTVQDKI